MTAALVLRWKPVAVAAIAATLVASLGGLATQLGPLVLRADQTPLAAA